MTEEFKTKREELGEWFRNARERARPTQAQVAAAVDHNFHARIER